MIQQNSPLTIWSDDAGRAIDLSRRSSAMGYGNLNIAHTRSLFHSNEGSFFHSGGGGSRTVEDATSAFTMSVRKIHIVDLVGLSDERAIELIQQFASCDFWNPWIVLGDCASGSQVVRWLRMGVTDYIDWPVEQAAFEESLKHAEEICVRIQELQEEYRLLKFRSDSITEREKEVMEMVLQGVPNKSIATRLAISRRTVEARRQKIYYKMSTQRVNDLIRSIDRLHYLGHELRKPYWIATLADKDATSFAAENPLAPYSSFEKRNDSDEGEQLKNKLVSEPDAISQSSFTSSLENAQTENAQNESEETFRSALDCGSTIVDENQNENQRSDP